LTRFLPAGNRIVDEFFFTLRSLDSHLCERLSARLAFVRVNTSGVKAYRRGVLAGAMVEKLIEVVLGDGQLLVQLADRLRRIETAGLQGFAEKARMLIPKPAIIPFQPSLTPPGAETARLEGHAAWVTSLCLLADGRLVSGSQDNTIRLWDMAMGAETACLEGHTSSVRALCVLPDGRLASGSGDNTIRLWDVGKVVEIVRLELDAPVFAIVAPRPRLFVVGDDLGQLHWLEVLD
jgi:hypothetical protein